MHTVDRTAARSHRLLRIVMQLDQIGSFTFVPVMLGAPAALAIFHPHGVVLALIWSTLSFVGLSLGVLGILMAAGLTRAMMRGEEMPERWFLSLFDYQPPS